MTSGFPPNAWSRLLGGAAAALIVLLVIFRFVHLDADFPPGITWSGELYTDEGWYSSAAINRHLTGNWLLEGDFNPVVNMPVFHLVQAAVFSLFGMSLQTARCAPVCFSAAIFLFLYLFARQYISRTGAALCVLFLASNYICFAYSRLALLELPMICLIVLSLYLGSSFRASKNILMVFPASCILVIAILLKNTAVFAIPVLMYVLWRRGGNRADSVIYVVVSLVTVSVLVILYNGVVSSYYPDDYYFFKQMNIDKRISYDIRGIFLNIKNIEFNLRVIDPILYCMAIYVVVIFSALSSEFRNNVLVRIAFIWLICYLAFLAATFYHPMRYFIPLMVPCAMLLGTIVTINQKIFAIDKQRRILLGAIIVMIAINLFTIVDYMSNLDYSFRNMCHNVVKIVDHYSTPGDSKILLGNFAYSVSIETGLRSINTNGSRDLAWRVSRYNPGFYISLGEEEEVLESLSEMYDIKPLCPFNVFKNYSKKRQVWFFQLVDEARS